MYKKNLAKTGLYFYLKSTVFSNY